MTGNFLSSLLDPYIRQVEEQLASLSVEGALENFEEVRGTAHSIKGSSRNLSMLELGNEAEILEHAGKRPAILRPPVKRCPGWPMPFAPG